MGEYEEYVRIEEFEQFKRDVTQLLDLKADANPSLTAYRAQQMGGTPPSVTGISVTPRAGSITLSWNPTTIGDLRRYEVNISTDPYFTAIVYSADEINTSHTWSGGEPYITYYLRVRAVGPEGPGGWSATINSMTGVVFTGDIEVDGVNEIARFTKTSGFSLLDTPGESQTYGPLIITVADNDSVVDPRLYGSFGFRSLWSGSSLYQYMIFEFLRRPLGGSVDTVLDWIQIDAKSTIPTDTVTDPTDFALMELPVFAAFDQPGIGTWEYRYRVTVDFDNLPGVTRIAYLGYNLEMEFVQTKR